MIIILEGPDGAGKTMLAQKLAQQTGYTLLHRSQPKTEEDKQRMMDEYLQVIKSGQSCIFDRCWYSEMVYGPVMRDASVITYPQMFELEKRMMRKGALIIHCTGPLTALWRRCTARGEDYIVDKKIYEQIYYGYYELLHTVPHLVPVVTYEYQGL